MVNNKVYKGFEWSSLKKEGWNSIFLGDDEEGVREVRVNKKIDELLLHIVSPSLAMS